MHLVENNNLLPTKLKKKNKITKEVFGAIIDKDRDEAKIHLQQVSTSFLTKKKKISSMLNTFSTEGKAIILANIPKKKS